MIKGSRVWVAGGALIPDAYPQKTLSPFTFPPADARLLSYIKHDNFSSENIKRHKGGFRLMHIYIGYDRMF